MKKVSYYPYLQREKKISEMLFPANIFFGDKDFHILVVDDSSPDGTAEIVKTLQNEFPAHLHLSVRKAKNGLGKAYLHGFGWALRHNYDYILRWMLISHTIPMTYQNYWKPVKMPICP